MNKLLNIPFILLTFSFIIGILCGHYVPTDITVSFICITLSLIGLLGSWWYTKKLFKKSYSFSVFVIITFVIFGSTLVQIHHPKNSPNHYTNTFPNTHQMDATTIHFYIKERLKPTSYYEKYIITLQSINHKKIIGNLLLQLPKNGLKEPLITGASYITYAEIKSIPTSKNPYQFDYATYLSRYYIYHKITVDYARLISTETSKFSSNRIAALLRMNLNKKLISYDFSEKQLSIINALLLGQRQNIDNATFTDYRDAGAIHILAVSGLHVGILLLVLNMLFTPLNRFGKIGKILKTVLIILSLWCFAIIAGLSPSVLRAVTMFSFIAIGMLFRTKTNIYNALIISMFILLCIRPLSLFDVGFQLSYIAVVSIVWIQPSLVALYNPRYYIDKTLWETFTVTIAAQLGILPLSLFYFHQFPLLFFVANLIIIPILEIILCLGILVLVLSALQCLPHWIGTTFGSCIDTMNTLVHWVASQEAFVITEISFSWRMLVVGYTLLISLIVTLKKFSQIKMCLFLTSITVTISVVIYEKKLFYNKKELVVFHNPRTTAIGVLQNQRLDIYSKDSISKLMQNYVLSPYYIGNNLHLISNKKLQNVYRYGAKTILIIDSTSIYKIKDLQPDIIILSNAPKIHLEKVIHTLKPKQIIADGSNYKSYLDNWEQTCRILEIPFHRTDKKGAYIFTNAK